MQCVRRLTGALLSMAIAVGMLAAVSTTALASGISVNVGGFQPIEGSTFGGQVATFTVQQPCSDNATYAAKVSWGDGASSAGAVLINGTCANGYTVISSHTYAEERAYTVKATVTGSATSGNGSGSITVSDAALTAQGQTIGTVPGHQVTRTAASFRDADPKGTSKDYSATIGWGDGTPTSSGVVSGNSSAGFKVAGTHAYVGAGPFTTAITISDVGGANTIVNGKAAGIVVAVSNITLSEGGTFGGVIATFDDLTCTSASYSDTVKWGDGTSSSGAILSNGGSCGGGWSVETSHSYTEGGHYKVVVTVTGNDGGGGSGAGTAKVIDVVISGFTPTNGPVGTSVAINGSGFADATTVNFQGVSATFVINSDNSITAVVPIGATTGKISVLTPGWLAVSSTAFAVT